MFHKLVIWRRKPGTYIECEDQKCGLVVVFYPGGEIHRDLEKKGKYFFLSGDLLAILGRLQHKIFDHDTLVIKKFKS